MASPGESSGEVVKLLGMWASLAVRRVEWALKMKGIDYEYVEVDLTNKSDLLCHNNPTNKQVPVLLHGGRPITESLVIIDYLDDVWKDKPAILPRDPYERARARFWATFAETKLLNAMKAISVAEDEQKASAVEAFEEHMRTMEGELEGGKAFFAGAEMGYVDVVVGWMALWLGVNEELLGFKVLEPAKFPLIVSWAERFLEVPVIRENVPDRQRLLDFFGHYFQYGHASLN